MAVVEQPKTQFGMMPSQVVVVAASNAPPGLEYLAQIDELQIEQRIDIAEVLTGFEIANKYAILNKNGQQVFYAQEETDCCHRQCCGPNRGYVFHVVDNSNQEVLRLEREFKCCAGCCWCGDTETCGWEMRVEAPPGYVIGYVRQQQSWWKPHFAIYDSQHQRLLEMWGPCCQIQSILCQGDLDYEVSDPHNRQISRVWKQYDTCIRDCCTNADTYGVKFPMEMDVRQKALLMASTILIDFMFFEYQGGNGGGGG